MDISALKITEEQLQQLLSLLSYCKDSEFDCEDCLRDMAEFAETAFRDLSLDESLSCIDQHLMQCGHCLEEFEALKVALKGIAQSQ